MNRIFEPRGYSRVRDGTDVSPFLNATDTKQMDVPRSLLGDMSTAAGRIGPKIHSWVHLHPVVTQVTYLFSGRLCVRMQDAPAAQQYDLALRPGQAVVTPPETLFQLRNDNEEIAELLYITAPSYVHASNGNDLIYDDAVMVAESWEGLGLIYGNVSVFETQANRARALRRIAELKGDASEPLTKEDVLPSGA